MPRKQTEQGNVSSNTLDQEQEVVAHAEIPVDGSQIIADNLTAYGKNILQSHFPQGVDGLKLLYRRAIWLGRKWPDTGQGSEGAVGQIKELHNHSPEAIYTALARMAQDFQFNPSLIVFHGNGGSYRDPKPAASRYTDVSLHPFARDVFFKDIEIDAIPMMQGVDLKTLEPQYLVPSVPLALSIGNTTVGYGFGSKVAPRNLGDICDLVAAYCSHLETHGTYVPFKIHRHGDKLLPDFPIDNVVTNHRELLAEYKKGNFTARIDIEGSVTLTKDSIRVWTLPFGKEFNVVEVIRQAINDAKDKRKQNALNQWIEQNIIDAQIEGKCVAILLKRTTTAFEAWEKIQRFIGFSDTLHANQNYVDPNGYIYEMSPIQILEVWYRKRHDLLLSSKRRRLRRLVEQLRIIEALMIVCKSPEQKKAILDMLQVSSRTIALETLVSKYDMTLFQAEHILQARLSILTTTEADELRRQHEDQIQKVKDMQQSLLAIPKEIAQTAQEVKKKYAVPRSSKLPVYTGHVSVLGGCVQFETPAEIEEILTDFPKVPVSVFMYDGPVIIQVDANGRFMKGSVSKYTTGDIYGLPFDGNSGFTVNIAKDGAACCVRGIVPGRRTDGYFYTTKKSIIIRRSGKLEHVDITQVISQRKTICRGAVTDIVHMYPETDKPHFVITASDSDQNVVTLQRVTSETGKILLPPTGEVFVAHHTSGKEWYFTLPESFTNRIATRVFRIVDAESILGSSRNVRIEVSINKWKRHPMFHQIS